MEKQWKQWKTIYLDSKITANGDCTHDIKRCFLLRRKAVTILDSILESRDITLPTYVCLVKAMVSPVVMYECESWIIKKAEPKNWCFWTVVLEKTLESPLDCMEIQPVHPKDQSWVFIGRTDVEAETPIFWPPDAKNEIIEKDLDTGKDWRREENGTTGWDGWIGSPARWRWAWVSSGSWWWTGKPGVLQSVRLQRVGHDWATELKLRCVVRVKHIYESRSVVSDSLWPHGLYSPWNSPGQHTEVGHLFLLQGICQGSNPGLPYCRQILYQLSHKGSSRILEWVAYPFFSRFSWPRNGIGVSCIAGRFFYQMSYQGSPKSLSHVRLFATPWTKQSMEFSRPKYWSG